MTEPQLPSRRGRWLVMAGIVIVGAVLTWLAFGTGLQQKVPADVTHGVELVPAQERSTGPRR